MKPNKIEHCNVNCDGTKNVVVNIALTDEDKEALHKYHIETGGEDYDPIGVSMLVWISINENGKTEGYSYDEACYYPGEQGETYYDNKFLPDGLETECVEFVRANCFGNESKYDC